MAKNLLIVESPAKAKTIEKILGKDFTVKSSFGHIRDLDKGNKGIDIENDFEPHYVVSPDKYKVVKELKEQVAKSSEVWLATDDDREGEAISWHLCEELNLDVDNTKRIVFSEITKPAILRAVDNPRTVDVNLVNAQQARRILDRIVGFELSEVLWRKVKNKLSAGRVQSVAVKLIVDREREIQAFDSKAYFKIQAFFDVDHAKKDKVQLKAEYPEKINESKDAIAFLEKCNGASFTVASIDKKPVRKGPSQPFITSTLQQEASRKLGFSVNRTMSTAQKLYESGLITYMRTDSPAISEVAMAAIAQEIKSNYGDKYYKPRKFKAKAAGAQEAHEAIRPTDIQNHSIVGDNDMVRLYDLIWKRTIASQMSDAELERTIVKINISTLSHASLEAVGEVLVFDGFLKVYMESTDDEEDEDVKGMLPPLKVGQLLHLNHMLATETFTKAPPRYTEASLVKKLEELGIGRPSTYAPTITKIMEEDRGYVTKESRPGTERIIHISELKDGVIAHKQKKEITGATKNMLYSSDIGMVVSDFLTEHFDKIMDYGFTANVENQLDKIASDGLDWKGMLRDFYTPFHAKVANTMEHAERAKGKRILGKDDASGYSVLAQMTRFGPVIQLGDKDELGTDEKPRFANLQPGQSIETITLEEALNLFKLPRTIGTYKGADVLVNNGRYGPYIKINETYINLGRAVDPMTITLAEAVPMIEAKFDELAPIGTYENLPITKGKGRFGPFVKWNNLFVNIPKKYDIETITGEEAIELIKLKVEKEANRYIQNWPEESISIENGRWGPYVKFGKNNIKIPKIDGEKADEAFLKDVSLEMVKSWITAEIPTAFSQAKTTKPKVSKKK
ncbi:MAG: type I DNA topoisomerase [Chitinophagales bacterium]|nr:type I DNA topoisomerase [Chitinophagales bacterium]